MRAIIKSIVQIFQILNSVIVKCKLANACVYLPPKYYYNLHTYMVVNDEDVNRAYKEY